MGNEETLKLSFEPKVQVAVLGHLIYNENFFKRSVALIEPEYFLEPINQKVWRAVKNFHEKHKRCPTPDELKELREFKAEEQAVKNQIRNRIDAARISTSQFQLDFISSELTDWLKSALFKEFINKAQTLYNRKKTTEAFSEMRESIKKIDYASFEDNSAVEWGDIIQFYSNKKIAETNACTFGHPAVDDRLISGGGKNGALLAGDMTIILAPTNVGKTTCMITVAKENAKKRKSVLWLAHEGRVEDLKAKFYQSFFSISGDDMEHRLETDSEFALALVAQVNAYMAPWITFIPAQKPGMTVEEVYGIIQRAQCERIAATGKGYDIIMDDYPAILTTQLASKGNMPTRDRERHIYQYFSQIALEFKAHVLCAIQTNREGSKINSGVKGTEERLLQMEDVAESFGTMQVASNVITINRDPIAEKNNIVTYYVAKSRSNEKGWAVSCRSNYAASVSHSPDLPATWYRGAANLSDRMDMFIQQHASTAVPEYKYVHNGKVTEAHVKPRTVEVVIADTVSATGATPQNAMDNGGVDVNPEPSI